MRFLVDECTGPIAAHWLQSKGHDVFSVYDQARGIEDEKVMERAHAESRVLITNDRGFGEKVFRERRPHHGVVFLRLADERPANKIRVLSQLLDQFSDQLIDRFVVVTETRVRFARQ